MGGDFGQTEVEDLGVSALGDEDVGGLNVAMDDALGMCGVEAVGDSMPSESTVSMSRGYPR